MAAKKASAKAKPRPGVSKKNSAHAKPPRRKRPPREHYIIYSTFTGEPFLCAIRERDAVAKMKELNGNALDPEYATAGPCFLGERRGNE